MTLSHVAWTQPNFSFRQSVDGHREDAAASVGSAAIAAGSQAAGPAVDDDRRLSLCVIASRRPLALTTIPALRGLDPTVARSAVAWIGTVVGASDHVKGWRVDLIERSDLSARRHPWEVARAGFFLRLLTSWGTAGSTRVLDVGAGDAWFGRQLVEMLPGGAEVICWDVNYTADDLSDGGSPSDIRTIPGLVLTADLPPGRFDGILMLDVIEHVEDDVSFVRQLVEESLVEGGWALISVPAYQGLFTVHDRALRHYRRYSPRQCRQILREAGLVVEWEGGLFHSLLVLRAVQALKERAFGPGEGASEGIGAWRGGVRTTRLLANILDAEGRLALALGQSGFLVPGLSYWACCRRAAGALPSSSPAASSAIAPSPPTSSPPTP